MEGKGFGIFPPKNQSDGKPKLEADFKIKIEPIEEFDSGLEIITKMNVPARIKNENIDIHPFKKPKIEKDVKPKIEADIKIKTEPIEEFNRSIDIVTNMNVSANVEIKNEKIEQKMAMDIKPKIEAKIEPIDDINRGMDIVGDMDVPANGRRACGFQNLVWTPVYSGHNLPPPVEIGLMWLPKLGVDTSPRPHAHRRA